jgi:hypothetical protein
MFLKCISIGYELGLEIDPINPFSLKINENGEVKLTIRKPSDEELKIGYKTDSVFCISKIKVEPSSKILACFNDLISNEPPNYIKSYFDKMSNLGGEKEEYEEIRKFSIPVSIMPEEFKVFFHNYYQMLTNATTRAIKLIRWRYKLQNQAHNPLSAGDYKWSFNGHKWHPMPHSGYLHIKEFPFVSMTEEKRVEIQHLLDNSMNEPIYHDLFLEAMKTYRERDYRSSIILSITAIETSIKQTISDFVPLSAWLITEIPTPPVEKLFAEYLPLIVNPDDRKDFFRNLNITEIRNKIRDYVRIRNELVHGKNTEVKYEKVLEIIEFTRNFLCLSDYLRGNNWARDLIDFSITGDKNLKRL